MRIISVQSIAGGTGVTSVATEIIADKLRAKEAILAIDLGNTQMLGRKNLGRGFETLGDASLIFGAWPAGVWLRQEALPRLCLLDLREQRHPYDACEEEVLLALTCYDSVGDILDRLRDQMASFATRFDSCVVDLSQAPDLLRRLFIAVSDEVHFCERLMSESQTWEAFREKFLDGEEYKPDQIWPSRPQAAILAKSENVLGTWHSVLTMEIIEEDSSLHHREWVDGSEYSGRGFDRTMEPELCRY